MKKQLKVIYTLACAFSSIQKVNIAKSSKIAFFVNVEKRKCDYVKGAKKFYTLKFCSSSRGVEQMNSNIRSEHVLETSFGVIVFVLLVMQTPYARKK
ncbi:hypothetical protein T07_7043 [Trichinella nelsoni]|uniref:Uncharacterized protein n=1 Tax=Trichinella nelsoni TaxID=6336 RepID=A0A0V0RP85_9BILA|nr:hypothetical protein T07_7043 [Trichinella nelsoni]